MSTPGAGTSTGGSSVTLRLYGSSMCRIVTLFASFTFHLEPEKTVKNYIELR